MTNNELKEYLRGLKDGGENVLNIIKSKEIKPIIPEDKQAEFEKLSRPLMKWLADNTDPHATIIITYENAEIKSGLFGYHTDDFVLD